MSITTVLLVDMPRFLEEMICSVLKPHFDIRVICGAAADRDLVAAAAAAGAQVVVVTRRDPANLAEVDPRLTQAAAVSVLALAPDGAAACLHTLRADSVRLEDVSAADILHALAASRPVGRA